MAELQRKKQENKKVEVTATGNGIGGLLALGGALAAAAFVAAISKQSNRRPNNSPGEEPTKNPPSEEVNCSKEEVQGLLSILDTTSLSEENHQCTEEDASRTCSKLRWSHGSVAPESLEQKSASNIKRKDVGIICENGNAAMDSAKTDSSAAADYDTNDTTPIQLELHTFSDGIHGLIDNQNIKVSGNEKEDSLNSSLAETVAAFEESAEVIKELKMTDREERVVEEYPSMQTAEEEEEEEEDGDEDDDDTGDGDEDDDDTDEYSDEDEVVEEETVEESSDGTGESSMESITEAIWPVDSMEEFTEKVIKSHVESSGEDEKSVELLIKYGVKISKENDDKGTAHDKYAERRNKKQQNAKFETTRKVVVKKQGNNKACEKMQMKTMNSALDTRPIWAWALLGFMVLMLVLLLLLMLFEGVAVSV